MHQQGGICPFLNITHNVVEIKKQLNNINYIISIMNKYKSIFIVWKSDECGKKHTTILPLVINEEDWNKTRKQFGDMIVEKRI